MSERTSDCAHRIAKGGWGEDAALGRCSYPIGPRNTYSNAAYAVAGLALVAWRQDPATITMGASLGLLAIGSWAYHGWKTKPANWLDRAGMLAVTGSLLAVTLTTPSPWVMTALAAGFIAIFGGLAVKLDITIPMAFLLLGVGVPAVIDGDRAWALSSLALLAVAYLAWQLDRARSRWVGIWGHAAWHVLTAGALAAMFVGVTR